MSTYVVGDIQGCYDSLMALLDKCQFDPETDCLWCVGDLISRGPNSLETLSYLTTLKNLKIVLGNHDLHFLAIYYELRTPKKNEYLEPLLASDKLDEFAAWYRQQPLIHCEKNVVMSHAGIWPFWSINEACQYAKEVEATLQSDRIKEFLEQMYGQSPSKWVDNLAGYDRLRFIVNAFTRMRYCNAQGHLELSEKRAPGQVGALLTPWFKMPNRPAANEMLLFGHWASLEGKAKTPNVIALDTGCVWGHTLTAYRLEDGQFFHQEKADKYK